MFELMLGPSEDQPDGSVPYRTDRLREDGRRIDGCPGRGRRIDARPRTVRVFRIVHIRRAGTSRISFALRIRRNRDRLS